jgi:hypothetical protein
MFVLFGLLAGEKPGVPAGAVEIGPGAWRWADAEGKAWIYRQSLAGVIRGEEHRMRRDLPPGMKAAAEGERVKFERTGLFGPVRWSKHKSDLTAVERRVFERDCKAEE